MASGRGARLDIIMSSLERSRAGQSLLIVGADVPAAGGYYYYSKYRPTHTPTTAAAAATYVTATAAVERARMLRRALAQLLLALGLTTAQVMIPAHEMPVLLDCVIAQELGCFKGATGVGDAFAFNGSSLFVRSMNRDRSPDVSTGNSPQRCAEFCATHHFELSAVSEDNCMCGNSTAASGARVTGGKCAAEPPAPTAFNLTTRKYTAPGCLDGTASCACSGNTSAACGNPGVARVFRHSCRPTGREPGRYLCPLHGGRYIENGSDVSYETFMDCFSAAKLDGVRWFKVPALLTNSAYPDSSSSMRPELGLICNMTKDAQSWHCQQAVDILRRYTQNPAKPGPEYHSYETVLAFQAVQDALGPSAGLNTSELAAFHSRILVEAAGMRMHLPKVENHGMDAASSQTLGLKVFPNLSWPSGVQTVIEGEISNWLHGHAVDEYAIGYVRLLPALSAGHGLLGAGQPTTTRPLHELHWCL